MTDPKTVTLQERLRLHGSFSDLMVAADEAADLLDRCKEALEPFARIAGDIYPTTPDHCHIFMAGIREDRTATAGEFRALAAILTQLNGGRNVG